MQRISYTRHSCYQNALSLQGPITCHDLWNVNVHFTTDYVRNILVLFFLSCFCKMSLRKMSSKKPRLDFFSHYSKSKKLPEGMRRRELYCWKHRWPQGKNVQAVVSHFGHCTELLIGMLYLYISLHSVSVLVYKSLVFFVSSNCIQNSSNCIQKQMFLVGC